MKLLHAPSGEFKLVTTPLSFYHLWHDLTFTRLIHYTLPCLPFKLNGQWTAALISEARRVS